MKGWLTVPGDEAHGRISSMEGLRAYAAGVVFFIHYISMIVPDAAAHRRWNWPVDAGDWTIRLLHSGQYGVDIFFLLSGYLIAGMVRKPDFRFGRFLVHRVARIYPAMLVALALFIAFEAVRRGDMPPPIEIAANLLLLNGVPGLGIPSILEITWSLSFEFLFYLTFPLLFLGLRGSPERRLGLVTIIALLVILPLCLLVDPAYLRFSLFLAGAWLRFTPEPARARLRRYFPGWLVVILYGLACAMFLFSRDWRLLPLVFIVPATLLTDRVLHHPGRLRALFSGTLIRRLGNISYSFYLLHILGLQLAAAILRRLLPQDAPAYMVGLLVVGLIVSLLLAAASFMLIERPYFTYRERLDRWLGRAA